MVISCHFDSNVSIDSASVYSPLYSKHFNKLVIDGLRIKAVVSDDSQKYLSCRNYTVVSLDDYFDWFWSLGPYLIYGFGGTIVTVLPNVIIIAQSPDKMKGLVFGISTSFDGVSEYFLSKCIK